MHPEHLDGDVALGVAGEHPGPDPPVRNALEVRAHRLLGARAARDVAERAGVELLLGRPLPVRGR